VAANATGVTVKVLFNRLPQLAADLKSQGEALVQDTAKKVAADAAQRAPVDTGRLRAGITVEGSGMNSTVTSEAPYSHYVEYGTSRMGAQPFFWPALEANRPVYLAAWRAILAGTGQRAGSATITPGYATTFRRSGGTAGKAPK
jgi:HK97 gp10 family phage protein